MKKDEKRRQKTSRNERVSHDLGFFSLTSVSHLVALSEVGVGCDGERICEVLVRDFRVGLCGLNI